MTRRIVAFDPGVSGAVALLTALGELTVTDMPVLAIERNGKSKRQVDAVSLADLVRELKPDFAIVEKVGAMPGQGVTSMFGFGRSFGVVEGVIAALKIPVVYVLPQRWQTQMGVGKGKDASRLRASESLPAYAERWRRVCDHGRADASLMALYGLLHGSDIKTAIALADEVRP